MKSLVNFSLEQHRALTVKETEKLIFLSQNGDEDARDSLINHNLRLVLKIAHRFKGGEQSLDEIFQIGTIGLIKAIDGFDISKGFKFSTYAVPLIIGEIKMFLRDNNLIKVGRRMKERAYKIKKIKEEMAQKLGRDPTIQEISEAINFLPEQIVEAMEALQETTSIYKEVHQSEGRTLELIDQIADTEDVYKKKLESMALKQILGQLDKRFQKIIKLRYFDEKTQGETAKSLGMSQAQISRLEKNILNLIRKKFLEEHRS